MTAALLSLLLALACITSTASAQSGRNKTPQGTDRAVGGSANPASSDSSEGDRPSAEEPRARGDVQTEVVEGDVVRVDTTLVTLPVSVRDRDGKYAPDLRREDFHVFEEGVEQRIAYFATVDQPFTVALVLDTSSSTDFRLQDMQDAAVAFVGQLKSEDRVLVVAFDDKVKVLAEPTSDRMALTKAIRRARSGGSTRLYDAVDFVIKQRFKNIEGRKAIVLFTDGIDTASMKASYRSTVRLAEELDALIYPVSYNTSGGRGLMGGPPRVSLPGGRGGVIIVPTVPGGSVPGSGGGSNDPESALADAYLHELAQKTGGRFYRGDTLANISQSFAWVAEELRRQYSIGYYPSPPGQAGQRRQLRVRVERPGLVVLTRDSYIYAQKKTDAGDAEGRQATEPDSQRNRLSGIR